MWEMSGQDIDFVSTMACENGTFEAKRIHSKNKNGTRDYSFGLNDFKGNKKPEAVARRAFIARILAGDVGYRELVKYHLDIYKQRKGAFYGYYKRNKCKLMFNLN